MRISSFRYLLKEGAKSLWKNRVMTFTSIGVLTTCLIIVGAAYLITVNVSNAVSYVETQTEMSIFLEDFAKPEIDAPPTSLSSDAASSEETSGTADENMPETGENTDENAPADSNEETDELKSQLEAEKQLYRLQRVEEIQSIIENNANVRSLKYISKEQGLEDTKELLGEDAYLIDDIKDRNYIPDTFVITLKDIALTAKTKADIENIDGVDVVKASVEVSDTLIYVQRAINTLGSGIILALAVISIVIISNTIRATIFARRKEINIMKFVGATNSFIRIPFIVEGFLLGLISAVISYFIIWGCYSYLLDAFTNMSATAWLSSVFNSVIPFNSLAQSLALFFGATGIVLGTAGSLISIKNHVKV